jgi:hypothetical protein
VHPATDPIADFLAAVRRRLRHRLVWGHTAAWVAGGAAAALLLLGGAAALGPSAAWRVLSWAVVLGLGATAIASAVRARAAWQTDTEVARFVEARLPSLRDDLTSAVELGRELPRLAADPVLSPELVRALCRDVAGRLGGLAPEGLVDLRPLRRRGALGAGALALAWLLVLALWPGALGRGWASLRGGPDDGTLTSVEPIVADLRLELRYPAYTGLAPRVVEGTSGQVLALPGTELGIEARALVPIGDEPTLLVEEDGAGPARALAVEAKRDTLTARLVAKRPGSYRFVLGPRRRRVREPEAHRIELEPDRAPRVELYAPAEALEVAAARRIELGYSVDDDFGLGELALVWRVGDAPGPGDEQRRVVRKAPSGRAASGKLEWDLGELDLKPGARVAYHLEAKDNDDVSGPNIGRSRTFYLSIFSPREKHEAALASEEQLLELTLGLLADRLELPSGDDPERVAAALAQVHVRAEALLALFVRVEATLDGDQQARVQLRAQLGEMHARLGKLTREEEALLGARTGKRPRPAAPALLAGNARHVAELERDAIALDDLLGRQRLEELLHVGDEMAQARDRLKSLLSQYKRSRSEALRNEIQRELRELERRLAELAQKSSRLAGELPDQFLNREAMGKNDLGAQLARMRELLDKGDLSEMMAELDRLSSSLDQMMASMDGDLRGYRRERFTAEDKALGELENKLADLEHDQRAVHDETDAVRKRSRAEAQRRMPERVPFLKRAREQVAQVKKHLDSVELPPLGPYAQDEIGRIKQRVADLDKMLAEGDLDEARAMARQADEGLSGLAGDLRDEEERSWRSTRPALKRGREHLEAGDAGLRALLGELDQAMPRPDQLLDPDDARRLGQLAERQSALKRRAGELDKRPGADGKPTLGPSLREAGKHMERAESRLRGRDARDAEGEEAQALSELSKLKEQLQRERRPREGQLGTRLDKEPVKIPGADEYRAPKEFRQDLLEAMKKGAPAAWREQVKRYYEELVK